MKFRVLGFDIPVVYQKGMTEEYSRRGHYSPSTCEIKIDKNINKQYQFECIVHEILEVIDNELVLKLDHDNQLCKIATGFFQVLRDNPKEFRRLLDV